MINLLKNEARGMMTEDGRPMTEGRAWKSVLSLLSSVLFLLSLSARADFTIEAYLTVKTNPAVGNTFSVTGVGITFTNNTGASSAWVQTTNSTANATTNLFQKFSLYGFTNVNGVGYTNATNLVVYGRLNTPLTITIGGTNWGQVTYITNFSAAAYKLALPLFTANTNLLWTNIANNVIDTLGYSNATSTVAATAPALGNFLNTATNAQSATNKSLFGGVLGSPTRPVYAGGITFSNAGLTFVGGSTQYFEMTVMADGRPFVFTGSIESSNVIARLGDVTNRTFQFNTNQFSVNSSTAPRAVTLQTNAPIYAPVLIGSNYISGDLWLDGDQYVGGDFWSSDLDESWDFLSNIAGKTSSTVLRFVDFNPAQFSFSSGGKVSLTNGVPLTNASFHGPWTNRGALLHVSGNYAALAVGNNIVTRSTNNIVRFTATAGIAVINAITNGFGDGDWFWGVNETGYTLILTNESGFTSIPENRLLLPNAASGLTVPNGSAAFFSYEGGSVTRWRVLYPEPWNATSTNVSYTISTNGTIVGVKTNANFLAGDGIALPATNNATLGSADLQVRFTGFLAKTNPPSTATFVEVDVASVPLRLVWTNLVTNIVINLTNTHAALTNSVTRELQFHFEGATNAGPNYTVTLTNMNGGLNFRWAFLTPTNGATSFTVTNNMRAAAVLQLLGTNDARAKWEAFR